ncbi:MULTISPECIES: PAS domain-containing sensor histidine kinase [unclassified Methanoculleus]|uniref:PAS domain-containing sensor histidine kinase n=1 Tax=unclassified Methanoculleus TaxID=2619537 RepID=UPI0025E10B67|nr:MULTISPECIES: PAS domain-containing sensor histidine kinase [unclassified Methanoculleus]
MNQDIQPVNLYLTLGKIAVFVFVLMSIYQFIKDYLYPEISLSESHLHTVIFTTVLAVTAAYFALRKRQALLAMLVAETNERRVTGEALQKSEEKFRSIVEMANEGILQIDRRQMITYVNRTMADMLSYSPGELLGRPLADFYFSEDLGAHRDRMAAKEQCLDGRYECRLRHRDGSARWVLVSVTARKDGDGGFTGSFAMFTDITERKQAEEALQRHTEDLARLHQQLASANREANLYLDILTHDIRNTENVANLYAELLIETLDGDERAYVEKLQRSIKKSIEILGNVSTIRRIHQPSGGHKHVDLDTVIRDEIAQFPESTIHYDAAERQVLADDLLPEVFANLIGNAVKFGGPGVEITVRAEDEDGFVRVSIEDTGPGVPDDQKREIFYRYEKRRRGVGEGLGLFLVQVLIERYGGRIWVEDRIAGRPEEGAAFRFTLHNAAHDEPGVLTDDDAQGCSVPLTG